MITLCPSKLWKAKFFILYDTDVIFIYVEAGGEIWIWSLSGVKGLKYEKKKVRTIKVGEPDNSILGN